MSSPKEFHIDAIYPEPLSRLRRGHGISSLEAPSSSYRRAVKKQRNRGGGPGRFRTQPITFQEIKEVDEDNIIEPEMDNLRGSVGAVADSAGFKSDSELQASFQLFYQSIKSGNDDDSNPFTTSHSQLLPLPPTKCLGTPDLVTTIDRFANPHPQDSAIKTSASAVQNSSNQQSAPINITLNARTRQSF